MTRRCQPLLVALALALLALGGCADDDDTTVPPGEGREVVPGEEGPVE